MSFRSALSNPSDQSGGVGTALSASATVVPSISTNQTYVVAQLELSKGLWFIMASTSVTFSTSTAVTEVSTRIVGGIITPATAPFPPSNGTYLRNFRDPLATTVAAAATTQQFSESITVLITEDNTSVQNNVRIVFTAGTGVSINALVPDTGVGKGALYAIKLA
jgi:hypothetical protein